MATIEDHPQRYALANELHARPFPRVSAPSHAMFIALMPLENGAARDREAERAHLLALLDRHGAAHPQPGATHYTGRLGRYLLKWESHTEFVTYTLFADGTPDRAFDPASFDAYPADWLAAAPGLRVTSALIHVTRDALEPEPLMGRLREWFTPESLACSKVLEGGAVVATDFRIDPAGHMRFVLIAGPETGDGRIGRIVQRLTEIETYKAMSMMGLPMARELSAQMAQIEPRLTQLVGHLDRGDSTPEDTLTSLLAISAELEKLTTDAAFRFGATAAYEAIVAQRVEVLREERFAGRQTFSEFMMRRFDPAMRTVRSTQERLQSMVERAGRAGQLLRTLVDVDRSAQNQRLLESMDRRADLQLRLQRTVEGLSIVAISYYAVNLAAYAAYPLTAHLGLSKATTTAGLTPVVLIIVWAMMRRIKKHIE